MIDVTDRLVALWSLKISEMSDFLMSLEVKEDGELEAIYRTRHYGDPDPWSDKDVKRWVQVKFNGATRDNAIEACRGVVASLEKQCGYKADEVMASSQKEYIAILKTMPWAYMKEAADCVEPAADEPLEDHKT